MSDMHVVQHRAGEIGARVEAAAAATPAEQQDLLLYVHQALVELERSVALIAERDRPPESRLEPFDLGGLWPAPYRSLGQARENRALQIDNPYGVALVVHAGTDESAAPLFRVPALSSRAINGRFKDVAIATLGNVNPGAAGTPALLSRFDRAVPPGIWPLTEALGSAAATPLFEDVIDRQARVLGRMVEQGGIADTISAAGQVTTPAAAAAIATIAAPGAGTYSIYLVTYVTGTAESAANSTNMQLQHGATAVGRLLTSTATPVAVIRERVTVGAGEAITVNAVALATTGSVYNALVAATQIA